MWWHWVENIFGLVMLSPFALVIVIWVLEHRPVNTEADSEPGEHKNELVDNEWTL